MEILRTVCRNQWCKATFEYTQSDLQQVDDELVPPQQCKKCRSFSDELSGGVEWSERNYTNDVPLRGPISFRHKVTNFR
jgi:hypothetical protein